MSGDFQIEWAHESQNARRKFVAYLHFVGWDCISLGISFCWSLPNVEVHLPFCFIRVGMFKMFDSYDTGWRSNDRTFGWAEVRRNSVE